MNPGGAGDNDEELLAELEHVRLTVTTDHPLVADGEYDDPAVAWWSSMATLSLPDVPAGPRHVSVWDTPEVALARSRAEGTEVLTIAKCSGLLIDLDDAGPLGDLLDQSADFAQYLPLFADPTAARLHPDFDDTASGFVSRLLILDRAEVAPAWRGLGGVGRLLAARSLRFLLNDATLVALQPHPTRFPGTSDHPQFPAAMAAIQRVWASLGFAAWDTDIWVMDAAAGAFHVAVTDLEHHLIRA